MDCKYKKRGRREVIGILRGERDGAKKRKRRGGGNREKVDWAVRRTKKQKGT